MRFLETRIPAPIIAAILGGLMKWHTMTGAARVDATPFLMYLGIGISQLAGLIAFVAFAALFRARTTFDPLHPARARRLVTHGIFRLSRNPLYVSLLLLLVAYAVRIDSLLVWLAPAAYVAYVTRFQIIPEERILEQKFGAAFTTYRQRTRRWV